MACHVPVRQKGVHLLHQGLPLSVYQNRGERVYTLVSGITGELECLAKNARSDWVGVMVFTSLCRGGLVPFLGQAPGKKQLLRPLHRLEQQQAHHSQEEQPGKGLGYAEK